MDAEDLRAALEYWRECGIDYLSGDRLSFPNRRPGPPNPGAAPAPAGRHPAESAKTGARPSGAPPATAKPAPVPHPPIDGGPLPALIPAGERPAILEKMAAEVAACQRCQLSLTRNKTVFGIGSPEAPVVFVGEGPGADEDRQGEPFVGAAGRLLNRMLKAVSLDRNTVYIANVVKCRPPGNRNPNPNEVAFCQGYLFRQLETIRPKVIFTLGKFAIQCLLGHSGPIGKARGRIHSWRGIPVIASYHPVYYLHSPGRKIAAWEDLLILDRMLARDERERPG